MNRAVLVTGASRGLGRATAFQLARHGFFVWAGVRNAESWNELTEAAHREDIPLQPLLLDITDRDAVSRGFETIRHGPEALFGVVNCAGTTARAFFDDFPEQEIERIFRVNVFGTMSVIRHALPLLRESGSGRIVVITSLGGRIASTSAAPYVASKFALEGLCESLTLELMPFGISVTAVAPGLMRTAIWDEDRMILPMARNPRTPYFETFWRMERHARKLLASSDVTPEIVAGKIEEILTCRAPRQRYVIGRRAKSVLICRKLLPELLFDSIYRKVTLRILSPEK